MKIFYDRNLCIKHGSQCYKCHGTNSLMMQSIPRGASNRSVKFPLKPGARLYDDTLHECKCVIVGCSLVINI